MSPLLPILCAAAAAATAAGLPGPDRLRDVVPGVRAGQRTRGRMHPNGPGRPAAGPVHSRGLTAAVLAGSPALGAAFGLALRGPVAAVIAALAVILVRRAGSARATTRVRTTERAGALEACACLSAELRAGRTAAEALALAGAAASGPVSLALVEAAAAARLGADVPAVLVAHAATSAAPELLTGLAACWQVCSTTGSGLARAVDRLGDGLNQGQAQRDDVEAELAGPRATAYLLAGLPLAGVALAAALGARPVHVLLDTALGLGCLVGGLALDALGIWWTGRIVRAAGGTT